MIYNNVLISVKETSDIEEVRKLLTQLAEVSLVEQGCARFELYQSQDQLEVFMLIEQWESQADLEQHRKSEAFLEIYVPTVLPLVERVPHTSIRLA